MVSLHTNLIVVLVLLIQRAVMPIHSLNCYTVHAHPHMHYYYDTYMCVVTTYLAQVHITTKTIALY